MCLHISSDSLVALYRIQIFSKHVFSSTYLVFPFVVFSETFSDLLLDIYFVNISNIFSPPANWGFNLDFTRAVLRFLLLLLLLLAVSSASSRSQWALGLHPRAQDHSHHCRTSAATARSQWALPGFSRKCLIAVGIAGLQPQVRDIMLGENAR